MSDRTTPSNPTSRDFPVDPDTEIFVMNADGSNQTQITFNEIDDVEPAWSAMASGSSSGATLTRCGARSTMTC